MAWGFSSSGRVLQSWSNRFSITSRLLSRAGSEAPLPRDGVGGAAGLALASGTNARGGGVDGSLGTAFPFFPKPLPGLGSAAFSAVLPPPLVGITLLAGFSCDPVCEPPFMPFAPAPLPSLLPSLVSPLPSLLSPFPLASLLPLSPLASPLAVPFASPLASPLSLFSPLATPLALPLALPFALPLASPLASPLSSPFPSPFPSPLASPLTGCFVFGSTLLLEAGWNFGSGLGRP
mmetsp:Transcript_30159/g.71866  ORF Transcript_30159/g.71866 Transcript_30159/m.71866 type:complete len:234 (-) Transcript_30159:204-905(-)